MPAGNAKLKGDVRELDAMRIAKKTTWEARVPRPRPPSAAKRIFSPAARRMPQAGFDPRWGPALKGEDSIAHWENGSLATVFDKIHEDDKR